MEIDEEAAARLGIGEHHLRQLGPGVQIRIMEREMLTKTMRPYVSVFLRVPSLFVIDAIFSQNVELGEFGKNFPWLRLLILLLGKIIFWDKFWSFCRYNE